MNEREGLDTIFGKLDDLVDDELKLLLTSPLLMKVKDSEVVKVALGLYKLGRKEMCKQLLKDYADQLLTDYLAESMKNLASVVKDDEILIVHAKVANINSEARYAIQFEIVKVSKEDKEKVLQNQTAGYAPQSRSKQKAKFELVKKAKSFKEACELLKINVKRDSANRRLERYLLEQNCVTAQEANTFLKEKGIDFIIAVER